MKEKETRNIGQIKEQNMLHKQWALKEIQWNHALLSTQKILLLFGWFPQKFVCWKIDIQILIPFESRTYER